MAVVAFQSNQLGTETYRLTPLFLQGKMDFISWKKGPKRVGTRSLQDRYSELFTPPYCRGPWLKGKAQLSKARELLFHLHLPEEKTG